MAFARFSKGLRRGSTKTETYSTLATRKYGRVQIIKDRVTDIKNPQTVSQMQQRVIFATITKAAQKMAELIEIAREGQNDRNFARQEFITENVAFIRSVAGRRVGLNRHYLAAYAPKGNQQLIPNSYIVSKGTLELPTVKNIDGESFSPWLVETKEKAGSFGNKEFFGDVILGTLAFGEYTHEQLWKGIFGLEPGDQLTFPQILAEGQSVAQAMYDGETLVDKTVVSQFAAPRVVLKDEFGSDTVQINANTMVVEIVEKLSRDIDETKSHMYIASHFLDMMDIDETVDEKMSFKLEGKYDNLFSVDREKLMRALGVILSRKVNGKWNYSTSQLCCVWDFIGVDNGGNYFGFTLDNAIETYLPTVTTDTNGNFLQRGGDSDIVPEQ